MAREKADYRPLLEDILSFTGGRRLVRFAEVCQYLGLSAPTVRKRYGITREGITAPALALLLARE